MMSGRARLPGGEPRKASQRKTRRPAAIRVVIAAAWRPGNDVRWKGRVGRYRRDIGDGEHCEILLESRVYRVPTRDLE
jgi:hypothetical protein